MRLNKYTVGIPYSYMKYGTMTCVVYANDEEEAADLVQSSSNRYQEDYNDNNSEDTNFDFSESQVEFEEEMDYDDLPQGVARNIAPYRLDDGDEDEDEEDRSIVRAIFSPAPSNTGSRFDTTTQNRPPQDSREALEDNAGDLDKLK